MGLLSRDHPIQSNSRVLGVRIGCTSLSVCSPSRYASFEGCQELRHLNAQRAGVRYKRQFGDQRTEPWVPRASAYLSEQGSGDRRSSSDSAGRTWQHLSVGSR
jgi:hypothetical protein